jgi:hypothetical protein
MDIRSGILSTAGALGVNPLDLATAISYETAGTFDPMKTGPTTQWGQHRGLIQFGEPQAKKYGVSWEDPVGSQLGPQGAVANYLRDTGVKPGMGLLDIYSAINAGGVGRYSRSDANNGGAPGTVRDKVEKQMAGHRKKAQALLGGAGDDTLAGGLSMTPSSPPDTLQGAQMQPEQQSTGLLGRMFPNMEEEQRERIRYGLANLGSLSVVGPNTRVMDQIDKRRDTRQQDAKDARQRTKTAEWLMTQPGGAEIARAIDSGAVSGAEGLRMWQQMSKGQAPVKGVEINGQLVNPMTGERMGDYRDNDSEMTTAVQGLDQRARLAGLQPGTPEYQQFMINGGASRGISLTVGKDGQIQFTQGNVGKPQDVTNPSSVPAMVSSIDGILNDPALDFATGFLEWTQNIPGTASKRFGARVKQLDGQAFLQAFESLKGGGHITEIEGQKATQAIGRLDASQSPEDYRNALMELKGLLQLGMERERTGGTIQSDAPSVNNIDINGTSYSIQRVD